MLYHMNKTFTQNDIIRFIYGEMNKEEFMLFECSLKSDSQLEKSYLSLKSSMEMIDGLIAPESVSEFTILKLKSFARAYSSAPSKIIDRIDFILN